jgi:hypothetical protein
VTGTLVSVSCDGSRTEREKGNGTAEMMVLGMNVPLTGISSGEDEGDWR